MDRSLYYDYETDHQLILNPWEPSLPILIGPTELMTIDVRKQLVKHLPARVEGVKAGLYVIYIHFFTSKCIFLGCPWSLVFSTSLNGFSLSSLYRKMVGIASPILLIIKDTKGNVHLNHKINIYIYSFKLKLMLFSVVWSSDIV